MFGINFGKSKKALVLMYHRVNTCNSDVWQLTVHPDIFAEQLSVISGYNVISMRELADGIAAKKLPSKSIAITFDDACEDNYTKAAPLLLKHGLPATFFVTNITASANREFWWNELEYLLIEHNTLPREVTITENNITYQWNLQDNWRKIIGEELIESLASWLPWSQPPTASHALFVYLSEWLKSLSYASQLNVLDQLYVQAGQTPKVRDEYKVINEEQLKALGKQHNIEIGGHSAYHTALGKFAGDEQLSAIMQNKKFLEQTTGNIVKGYGYAHGSYNETSRNILRENGFLYACTTEENCVTEKSDAFALPRMHVKNVKGAEFKKQLKKWFAI